MAKVSAEFSFPINIEILCGTAIAPEMCPLRRDVFMGPALHYPLVIYGEYWKVGFSACVVITDCRESLWKISGS